jgi:hypothetical protein
MAAAPVAPIPLPKHFSCSFADCDTIVDDTSKLSSWKRLGNGPCRGCANLNETEARAAERTARNNAKLMAYMGRLQKNEAAAEKARRKAAEAATKQRRAQEAAEARATERAAGRAEREMLFQYRNELYERAENVNTFRQFLLFELDLRNNYKAAADDKDYKRMRIIKRVWNSFVNWCFTRASVVPVAVKIYVLEWLKSAYSVRKDSVSELELDTTHGTMTAEHLDSVIKPMRWGTRSQPCLTQPCPNGDYCPYRH